MTIGFWIWSWWSSWCVAYEPPEQAKTEQGARATATEQWWGW